MKKPFDSAVPDMVGPDRHLLLHACCAPCSGAIVECLMSAGIRPVLFYSNPNIYPLEEYAHRRDEAQRYCQKWEIEFVEDPYDHQMWLTAVQGLESEPERGSRCTECFRIRLLRSARYAAGHGFDLLSTTLASSRWKNLDQVNAAGTWACSQVQGVEFWARNWRKGGLQERRNAILRAENFYNQLYCGCEFSFRL